MLQAGGDPPEQSNCERQKIAKTKEEEGGTSRFNQITAAFQEYSLKYPAFIVSLIKCQV